MTSAGCSGTRTHGIGTAPSSSWRIVVGVDVLGLGADAPRDAVPRGVAEDLLHVLRQHVGAAVQERRDPASASRCWYERGEMPSFSSSLRSARPTLAGLSRRASEADDVFEDPSST